MSKKIFPLVLVLILLVTLAGPGTAQAKPGLPPLDTLQPGGFQTIQQELKINLVFLGFEPDLVDEAAVREGLPQIYRVIHRYPDFYGYRQFLGNDFTFDYDFVYADPADEDALFAYLATDSPTNFTDDATYFQQLYSGLLPDDPDNQETGLRDITTSRYIDAPSVEAWLETNLADLQGDYTIFFINWYSRPDFQDHIYTRFGVADPDTGVDFGYYFSRMVVSWGGTSGRTWFYDFSAGPEAWTENFRVDNPPGYIIPPIWEYGNMEGRELADLPGDISKLARYVGINLLFTPSPLYKPMLSPPALPESINFDINVLTDQSGVTADDLIDQDFFEDVYETFIPYKDFSVDLDTYALDGRAAQVFDCFAADAGSCYGGRLFNIAFGDLFLYASDHILKFLDGDSDYEIPMFAYNTSIDRLGVWAGLLGFADDNWRDGTQTYIFSFSTPEYEAAGYGLTWTLLHEAGHHVGLSHPHDGYDYEENFDYGPDGDYLFAWAGDESDTIMHYMQLTNQFGVFNQDSMYRYETAGYINQANAILAMIAESPRADQVTAMVQSADALAGQALDEYADMDYLNAVMKAQAAYNTVVSAALTINVPVEPQSWQADVKSRGYKYNVDPVRYPDGLKLER